MASNGGLFAALLNHFGDEAGPSGLVSRAETGAIVSVKKFIKENEVAPVGVGLKDLGVAVNGTAALVVAQKNVS